MAKSKKITDKLVFNSQDWKNNRVKPWKGKEENNKGKNRSRIEKENKIKIYR